MLDSRGCGLSDLHNEGRQYGGPAQQSDPLLDTTLTVNNTQGNDKNCVTATPSQIVHSQYEQQSQQSRLSPGYTRNSGQYALCNKQTGRGWKRVSQTANSTHTSTIASSTISNTAIDTNYNSANSSLTNLSPSEGDHIRDRGIKKLRERVASMTQRAIQASRNAKRFLTRSFPRRSSSPLPGTLKVGPKHATCGRQLDQIAIDTQLPLLLPHIIVTSPSGEENGVQQA
ncbi:hypothetical protein F4814DRAFT_445827 [Daldinia grandis]|nr:hypothetical protein F4814DRAFT_445827 [Daldinia grandis]